MAMQLASLRAQDAEWDEVHEGPLTHTKIGYKNGDLGLEMSPYLATGGVGAISFPHLSQ
jgi:hypothetical protein